MTKARDPMCDHVQLAVMAKLDGERPLLTGDEFDAHVAGCDECRDAIAGMTRLHARLDALSDDAAPTDLWAAIHPRIAPRRIVPSGRERVAVGALVALVLAWRTAQLVFDVPVPVLNGLVPLAVAILIGWRVAGDPLAIQSFVLEDQQERA